MSEEPNQPYRSYNRTWAEIEAMLEGAEDRLVQWKTGMSSAARKVTLME